MTLEELYAQIGGDYAEAIGRLRSEALVGKFIVRFLDDESCPKLVQAWGQGNDEEAFAAAHTAKGVCANLALTDLAAIADALTEALRPGNDALRAQTDVDALVRQLDEAYRKAEDGIRAYAAS